MANEVRVLVTGNADQAVKEIKRVDSALGGLGTAAKVGVAAIAGIGAAGVAGLGLSIKSASDFEHALDQVGAVANATKEEMKGLNDTALRIGKDTAFSATEAASAMEMLAANGVSVADIMNGAADAAVALAAAGGTDLATAADTASTAMAVWGLSAEEMADVVNRLAGAANVSRFGVEDMAGAIAQGGGAAKTAGVEFGDFAAAIAAIAPSFSSGSDAGTSMKTMLAGLVPDTKAATKAMLELGIITKDGQNQFFTAKGELKSMAEIAGILNTATKDLTEEQKTLALTQIFGSDAMRAAAAMAGLTEEEFRNLQDTMGNTDAAEVAAQRMGNFKGSMEELQGSIETIMITIGQKFLPALTEMAGWAAEKLPAAFAKFEADIVPKIEKVAAEVGPKLAEAFEVFKRDILPGLIDFAREASDNIASFVRAARPHIEEFSREAQRQFGRFREYWQTDIKPALDNIETGIRYVVGVIRDNWDSIKPVFESVAAVIKGQLEAVGNALQIVIDILGGDWSGAWNNTKQLLQGVVDQWKNIMELGINGLKAFISIAKDVGEDIIQGLQDGLTHVWNTWVWPFLKSIPRQITGALGDLSRLLFDIGKSIIQGLWDGMKDVWGQAADWLGSLGGTIKSLKGPIEEDRRLLFEEGMAIIEGLGDGMQSAWPEVRAILSTKGEESVAAMREYLEDLRAMVQGTAIGPDDWLKLPGGGDAPLGPGYGGAIPPKGAYNTDLVWDEGLGAYVMPGMVGSYGTGLSGDTFKSSGRLGKPGGAGSPAVTVNIGTYNNSGADGDMTAGDLMYALGKAGLA